VAQLRADRSRCSERNIHSHLIFRVFLHFPTMADGNVNEAQKGTFAVKVSLFEVFEPSTGSLLGGQEADILSLLVILHVLCICMIFRNCLLPCLIPSKHHYGVLAVSATSCAMPFLQLLHCLRLVKCRAMLECMLMVVSDYVP
jgi:hypothetical protein